MNLLFTAAFFFVLACADSKNTNEAVQKDEAQTKGADQADPIVQKEDQDSSSEVNSSVKSKAVSHGVFSNQEKRGTEQTGNEFFTITHKDDVEKVFFHYFNPKNNIEAEEVELEPFKCFKFTKEQYSYITLLKAGVGGFTYKGYKHFCSDPDVPRGFRTVPTCEARLSSNYVIEDTGLILDNYSLIEAEKNFSENCALFEEYVASEEYISSLD